MVRHFYKPTQPNEHVGGVSRADNNTIVDLISERLPGRYRNQHTIVAPSIFLSFIHTTLAAKEGNDMIAI